jgi:O-antigen ligase
VRGTLAILVYFAGLLPYLEAIPIRVAYLVVMGSLSGTVALGLWSTRMAGLVRHRIRMEFLLWALVLVEAMGQLFLLLRGDTHTQGVIKAIAYIAVTISVYAALTCILVGRRRDLWASLALLGVGLGGLSVMISWYGAIHLLGLRFEARPWKIPLLGWAPTSSIFQDENFAAVVLFVCLMGAILSLLLTQRWGLRILALGGAGLISFALLLTHSRAAYLALVVAAMTGYLSGVGRLKKFFALVVLLALGMVVADFLWNSDSANRFLEVQRGMTGRWGLWKYAVKKIAERPLLGWGVGNVGDLVRAGPGYWASTHNSFLDFALMFGVPTTLLYLVFLFFCMWRIPGLPIDPSERRVLFGTCTGLLVIANFTTHTLGGVSFGSLSLGVFLGMPGAIWSTVRRDHRDAWGGRRDGKT